MNRKLIGGIAIGVAVLTLVVVGIVVNMNAAKNDDAQAEASPSAAAQGVTKEASPTPSEDIPKELEGCMMPAKPIIPKTLEIPRIKVKSPVLSLGAEHDGKPIAPPDDQLFTTAWLNEGPRIGSSKGYVTLTAHTHASQDALGNQLADTKKGLQEGDIIRVSDAKGQTVCYRFAKKAKIWVDTYNPEEKLVYNNEGTPKIVWQTCADYQPARGKGKEWASRVIYYADLINKP